MPKRILQVVDSAYRATLEEQDDTVLWITQAMKGAGGDFSVLLRGSAVNYAVRGQDASGLAFGAKRQTQPPRIAEDVAKLIEKGIEVFVVSDDLAERGLERGDLIAGPKPVSREELAKLFAPYDMVWHW
jgi:sulfur relay (sulfurtransferase) DsrF/TusC family protein